MENRGNSYNPELDRLSQFTAFFFKDIDQQNPIKGAVDFQYKHHISANWDLTTGLWLAEPIAALDFDASFGIKRRDEEWKQEIMRRQKRKECKLFLHSETEAFIQNYKTDNIFYVSRVLGIIEKINEPLARSRIRQRLQNDSVPLRFSQALYSDLDEALSSLR